MTNARAAVLHDVGKPFVLEDVVLDAIRPDELLVRIVATGLCHTDLAVQHGHFPARFPAVLGHEGAGIVERVGAQVSGFAAGDRVALSFSSCGACANCRRARPASCFAFMPLNLGGARADGSGTLTAADGGPMTGSFFGQSSFATYAIATPRNAVKLPDSVPLEIAGPLGCGLQTGAGTVLNTLGVEPASSIVVTGAGAVGLAAVMAARAAGATTIVAVDILDSRLELALELGATHAIDGRSGELAAQLREVAGPAGPEYAVDTTAHPGVIADLLQGTQPGAAVALLGVGAPDTSLPLQLTAGKRIFGAIEGDAVPQELLPRLVDLWAGGLFPFDRLIRTYPFDDIEQAIADTRSGSVVKAVLTM